MSEQGSLFGDLGRELKRKGLEQVSSHAPDFLDWARGEARRISRERGRVSINDLRPLADRAGVQPHHDNAWGAVFNEAGWLAVDRTYTKRAASHARVVRIWKWTGVR
jgi:hypothetical protein